MPRPRLAKLSRPRLHNAVARERLFRLLDAKGAHPVVWVTGPPGSGKTTLVASYLETSSAPAIWYLLDTGDSDPAAFIDYLAQAVRGASRSSGKPLPFLTEEYLPDLEQFARRFMRGAFARLAEGTLLVLDNYHEIAADSALHRMLHAAIAEIPPNGNLIVIGRTQPPPVFARARAAGTLEVLDWDELRLQPDETAAIVAGRNVIDAKAAAAIHEKSGGWVAGVRLLLERTGRTPDHTVLAHPEALESAFDYFAAEIFDSAAEPLQRFLMRTAFLPRFGTAMAAAVSGDETAAHTIEDLYKRRLFVDRRVSQEVTYQYHDLFRAFLRNRAVERLPKEEVATVIRESAAALLAAGMVDDSYNLFIQARDWENAEALLLTHAQALTARGRWQTLEEWGKALPGERLHANPWLSYWLGRSKALVDPVSAIAALKDVHASFAAHRDPIGELMSAAAVVECLHFTIDDWDTMGQWLERLTSTLEAQAMPLATDDELRVHATLFWTAATSSPGSPVIDSSAARTQELLPGCTDLNLRISVANMLHYLSVNTLDPQYTASAARAARPHLDSPDLSADRLALYYLSEGMAHVDPGRFEQALECYDRAAAIIDSNGLQNRRRLVEIWRALCHITSGNLQGAAASLAAVDRLDGTEPPLLDQCLSNARAMAAARRGAFDRALEHAQAARASAERFGPTHQIGFLVPNMGYMKIAAGRPEEAAEPLDAVKAHPGMVAHMHFGSTLALIEAWRMFRLGQQAACLEALSRTLTLSRDERERWRLRWFPQALVELLPVALEHGIETTVVCAVIRDCGLNPPPGAPESWPWPLRIYTLGRFEIMLDDRPLGFGRKAPKRTVALLKALVAFGGKDVPESRLSDALWPDLDGDAALESLAAALHRLRRLLGSNETIRQSHGALSLNEERCFVDAFAFESSIDQPDRRTRALASYRGGFLEGDGEAPWSASMRERLRGKFVRAVEATGCDLEDRGQYQQAIELYARGIETDDLVEPFYRGLMRCYHKLDRHSEAARAFQRLRQALSVTLGAKPSLESQRLFQELRLG
jgi:LuxR family transcriptional regulator, maltose regulon positive regulatory protein